MESYEEENAVLSPEDLVALTRLDPLLPHNGLKASEPLGTAEQAIRLNRLQAQQRELLNEKRVARIGNLSIGDWNQDLQLIEVRSGKGKFWHTMGYNAGSKKYLYPEEGLYLMESNMLELLYQGMPLALHEAYELLISTEFSMEEYQTYAHLMRLGYIVTKHKQSDLTEYEQRIKLYQHRTNRWQRSRKKVQVWVDKIADRGNTPNNSDSGDGTDESYCSSSSVLSLNSAGDFDTKVKRARQPKVENPEGAEGEEKAENLEMSDGGSSEYSDGPISELSPKETKQSGSDFDYSVVNLLDYHNRCCSSGSEGQTKVWKQKRSPWYIGCLDSAGSLSEESGNWQPPAKVPKRDAPVELSVSVTDQAKTSDPDGTGTMSEKRVRKEMDKSMDGNWNIPTADAVTAGKIPVDMSVDIDEFLQAVIKKRKKGHKAKKEKKNPLRPYSLWNFTKINIPDLGPGSLGANLLPASLVPEIVKSSVGENTEKMCQKHILNVPKFSLVPDKRTDYVEQEESGLDLGLKFCKEANVGKSWNSESKGPPSNWMEFKSLMEMPGKEKDLKDLLVSPVSHLWEGSVQPLVKPSDAVNPGALLRKLQVIQSADVEDLPRSCESSPKDVKITFDVHLPNSTFRKTSPGKPAFRIAVFSIEDPVPKVHAQMSILRQSGSVPLVFAIVDNADVTFCCLTDARMMTSLK